MVTARAAPRQPWRHPASVDPLTDTAPQTRCSAAAHRCEIAKGKYCHLLLSEPPATVHYTGISRVIRVLLGSSHRNAAPNKATGQKESTPCAHDTGETDGDVGHDGRINAVDRMYRQPGSADWCEQMGAKSKSEGPVKKPKPLLRTACSKAPRSAVNPGVNTLTTNQKANGRRKKSRITPSTAWSVRSPSSTGRRS